MIFFLDFETRSTSPLKVVGGRNYVDDPTTSVLALCGTDGVRDYVWSPFGGPLGPLGAKRPLVVEHGPYPTALVAATEGATLLAHNAEGFDRPLWEALGLPERVWIDSIPLARRAQLPGKLQDLAERVLGVGKDKAGRDVTLSLSKPVELSRAAVDLALRAAQDYLDGILYPKQGLATLTMLLGGPGRASNEALRALLESPPYGAAVLRDPSPAQLTEVVRYCLKDVDLMREACLRARLLEPHMDDDALEADRRINARGAAVDLPLVACLLRHADRIVAEAGAAASAATDGAIGEAELRKTAKLRSWLAENGVVVDDTKAETIKPLLTAMTPKLRQIGMSEETQRRGFAVATVLRARLDVARVSTGKLRALVNRTQRDGRLRGMHGYYDAHTGRWTGRDVQTQNLPRAIESTPESLPDDLLAGAPLPATSDRAALVGSLIRSCFVGDPGLIVADFSQVEARALCYLAGDEPGLAVYLSGADPYLRMASLAFGEPVTDKKDKRRQAGKVAELACLAEGTQVVTDRGLVAIEQVLPSDRLWDGVEWVAHDGLVDQGSRACMNLHGVWLTGDHLVLTEEGWCRADTPDLSPAWCSAPSEWSGSFSALQAGSTPRSACALAGLRVSRLLRTSTEGSPLDAELAPGARPVPPHVVWPDTKRSSPTPNSDGRGSTASPRLSPAAGTPTPRGGATTALGGFASTARGSATADGSFATSPPSTGGPTSLASSTGSTTTEATSQGTSAWRPAASRPATPAYTAEGSLKLTASGAGAGSSRPSGSAASAGSLAQVERPTFDLANAGPRSRFVLANGLVVHNCGYGGGPDALLRMAKKNGVDLESTGACPARLVEAWRDLHPAIAGERSGRERTDEQGRLRANRRGGFWKQLEREARRALRGEGDDGRFSFDGTDLFMHLPSGRVLRYRDAQLGPFEDRDDTIHYWNPKKKKRVSTYGGRLVENCFTKTCPVITLRGILPIAEVRPGDEVWDGQCWVRTDGAVCQGEQEVGEWLGLGVTRSHKILGGSEWTEVGATAESPAMSAFFLSSGRALVGSWWTDMKGAGSWRGLPAVVIAADAGRETLEPFDGGAFSARVAGMLEEARHARSGQTCFPTERFARPGFTATQGSSLAATTHATAPTQTTAGAESSSTVRGSVTGGSSSSMSSPSCPTTGSWGSTSTGSTTTGDTSLETSGWYPGRRAAATAGTPRPWSVPGRLSPSPRSGRATAPSGTATQSSTTSTPGGLPSGSWRTTGRRAEVWDLLNCGPNHRFAVLTSAGPVIVHNCVQAYTRDFLAEGLVRLEVAGYRTVLHTHDEFVVEGREDQVAEVCRIVSEPPAWAADFPLAASGSWSRRYAK